MHVLLMLIVVIASAFLTEPPKVSTPVINFRKDSDLEAILRAAEVPAPRAPTVTAPPAPAPVEPAPVPTPPLAPKVVEQAPPPKPVEKAPTPLAKIPAPSKKETPKEAPPKTSKNDPRSLAITPKGKEAPPKKDIKKEAKKNKEPEPEPEPPAKSTKPTAPAKSTVKIANTQHLVSRQAELSTQAREKADADARTKARADEHAAQFARQQLAAKMKSIIGGLQGGLSAPVHVQVDAGSGPNALAFLDYGQDMVRLYEQMWIVPPNLSEAHAVVSVTVTVARDGRVLTWRVNRPTGNAAVDKSVRETLEKVRQFEAFPASFRESQRTFNLDFNLKAKRSSG